MQDKHADRCQQEYKLLKKIDVFHRFAGCSKMTTVPKQKHMLSDAGH